MSKRPAGAGQKKPNKSNMVRSALFTFFVICFGVLLIVNIESSNISRKI